MQALTLKTKLCVKWFTWCETSFSNLFFYAL